jgi:hypothetical protein
LKQSPREWNHTLDGHLKHLGFTQIMSDRCIYVSNFEGSICYLLLYVDDFIIGAPNRNVMEQLKSKIHNKYPIKDKGPIGFFLNMHFARDRTKRTIDIHQKTKIQQLLLDYKLEG